MIAFRNVFGIADSKTPLHLFGTMILLGIALILISMAVHLDSIWFLDISKKLGYLYEINW